ncbi:MAG: hypothetical protein HC817_05765, partial [Saprospiraceae bacterium]|nr:hypothetical protein [Saprospiraceae bacterium]
FMDDLWFGEFFHGFNDGQKGIGLLLVTMLTFMPLKYSLSPDFNQQSMATTLSTLQNALPGNQTISSAAPKEIGKAIETIELLKQDIVQLKDDDVKGRLNVRKRIGVLTKNLDTYLNEPNVIVGNNERAVIKSRDKKIEWFYYLRTNLGDCDDFIGTWYRYDDWLETHCGYDR